MFKMLWKKQKLSTHYLNRLLICNFTFFLSFDADGQKPVDVRIVNLRQARLAHAVTDVLPLMLTAMGPKVVSQNRDYSLFYK